MKLFDVNWRTGEQLLSISVAVGLSRDQQLVTGAQNTVARHGHDRTTVANHADLATFAQLQTARQYPQTDETL